MNHKFIEILAETSELWPIKDFLVRPIQVPRIPGKATTIIGVRRSGKSTLMRQVALELLSEGVEENRIVFINFSDDRLYGATALDLNSLIEAHFHNNPDLEKSSGLYFFLDEIQIVPGWELFVDRLIRSKKNQVFISGSSAKLLSTEIATELRGRSLSVEVFPFSFTEVCAYSGVLPELSSAQQRGKLSGLAQKYLMEGGFPEILQLSPVLQKRIIQEYLDVMLLRDVIQRNENCDAQTASKILPLCLSSIASPITFTKLTHRLRSQGLSMSPSILGKYLEWFNDCYLFFLVPIFSESINKQSTNPRKLYCVDSGLIAATSVGISEKKGAILENQVFVHLKRLGKSPSYYKTQSGYEVDFVVKNESGEGGVELIQVCVTLQDEETKSREIRAIAQACDELSINKGTIVTLESDFVETVGSVEISVESFVKFGLRE